MAGSLLISSARTPIGRLGGALAPVSAVELGATAIRAALSRAGIAGHQVDHVVMGQVLQAGQGQNPARQAAVAGGIPMTVPAATVNKVCLSGLYAIHLADQMIQAGEAAIVVAGGMESMSRTPYLLPGARAGLRLGDAAMVDALVHDGLWCSFEGIHMGAGTESDAGGLSISREAQDELAARSHQRAAAAAETGRLAGEIVAVAVPQRRGEPTTRGEPTVVDADEGIRPGTTVESLARLPAAFSAGGTVTAGNASQISDGAAAVVVASEAKAHELGLRSRARLVAYAMVAGPGPSLLHQPSHAVFDAAGRAGLGIADLDLLEINEAFAAVALASMADLGVGHERVNINGGAIALGHPIGMSGTRIVMTLVEELRRRGGGVGAAALCGGGGQGDAAILEVAAPGGR